MSPAFVICKWDIGHQLGQVNNSLQLQRTFYAQMLNSSLNSIAKSKQLSCQRSYTYKNIKQKHLRRTLKTNGKLWVEITFSFRYLRSTITVKATISVWILPGLLFTKRYRQISWSVEPARFGVIVNISLWNLNQCSAAAGVLIKSQNDGKSLNPNLAAKIAWTQDLKTPFFVEIYFIDNASTIMHIVGEG